MPDLKQLATGLNAAIDTVDGGEIAKVERGMAERHVPQAGMEVEYALVERIFAVDQGWLAGEGRISGLHSGDWWHTFL